MGQKKILVICTTSEIGGGPEHVWQLLSKIDKGKSSFILAVPNNGPYFEKFKKLKGVIVHDISIRKLRFTVLLKLLKLVRHYKIDLIHSHGKGAGLYGRLLKILTGKPIIHTLHGIHYQSYGPATAKVYLLLEKLLSFLTDLFINVSEGEKKLAIRLGIYESKKSIVIYNGVQIPGIFYDRDDLKKKLGLPSLNIINVARFNPQKGHQFLIKAMVTVTKRYPGVKLVMLGHGEKFDEMVQLSKDLKVETNCIFLGFKSNVSEYLQASDVYVSSSLWEGLPISILEASANKLPVIATDVVGNNEIIIDNKTGLLARAHDHEDLANKVIKLLSDKTLRSNLANEGFVSVREKFSLEKMVSQTEAVYLRFLQ